MTERFDVDPGHVAGYGRLCADVSSDTNSIKGYLNLHASASDGFDGLLMGEAIAPIVDEYAAATRDRFTTIGRVLHYTGRELTNTAWTYLGADRPDRFAKVVDSLGRGTYRVELDHPELVAFPHKVVTGTLDVPPLETATIDELMAEHAGDTLAAIETIVATVTGIVGDEFSIMGEITDRVGGNWLALDQKATALENVAEAAEKAAQGLAAEHGTLDRHWDGGAADSFGPYLDQVVAGTRYEGPLNRVIAGAYRAMALLVEQAAGLIVELVSTGVDLLRKYATGLAGKAADAAWDLIKDFKPPWESLYEDWQQAKSLFVTAKNTATDVYEAVEALRELIEATTSMTAATDYSVKTILADLEATGELDEDTADTAQGAYDTSREATDIAIELAPALAAAEELAGNDGLENMPDHAFRGTS
ncbi:hypothetical protein [Actinophytocola sp. NPDC049390]|uniref:hypothetical protein n=1 Tax=Actinophytocola sp. NPDC049390 TaxID=3363894 RepID=UPI0037A0C3B2